MITKIFLILLVVFIVMAILGGIKADDCKTVFRDKIATNIACIGMLGTFVMVIIMATYGEHTTKDKKYGVCSLTTSTQTKEESAGLFLIISIAFLLVISKILRRKNEHSCLHCNFEEVVKIKGLGERKE